MKLTHDEERDDQGMSSASWFALGLISGAALALLTSPMNGRENRQLLRRRAREVADTVTQESTAFIDQQAQRVNEVLERSRAEAQAFGSRVTEAIDKGKSAYRAAATSQNG